MTKATGNLSALSAIRIAVYAAVPLLAASLVSPALADSAKSQDYYKDALEWLQKGDGRAALIQLRNAVKEDAENYSARLLLGRLYQDSANLPAARKELEIAYKGMPNDETEVFFGRSLLAGREYELLLSTVGEQASDVAFQPIKRLLRAEAMFGLGRLDDALAEAGAVLQTQPGHAQANVVVARIKGAKGDLKGAHANVATALASNPEYLEGYLVRAQLYYSGRDMVRALETLDAALKISPDEPRVSFLRAEALFRLGRIDEAAQLVEAFQAKNPGDVRSVYMLGRIYATQGRYEDADQQLRQISEAVRSLPGANLLAGTVKFQLGQYAQAEELLQRYIRSAGAEARQARRLLATIQLRTLRPRAALETLGPLVEGDSRDVASLQLAASANLRVGDLDAAKAVFERILRYGAPADVRQAQSFVRALQSGTPDATGKLTLDPIAKRSLTVLDLLRHGEEDEAKKEAELLAQEHPDNTTVANLLGGIYFARGDLAKAREYLEPALARDPTSAGVKRTLDRIDIAEGKFDAVEARMRADLTAQPENEAAVMQLAQFLAFRNRQDEAVVLVEEKAAALPQSVSLRQVLIRHAIATNNTAAARKWADESLAIGAGGVPYGLLLAGDTYAVLKDWPATLDAFERLTQATSQSPQTMLRLAQAQVQADQLERAAATLEQIIAKDPTNRAGNQALVTLRVRQRDGDAAMAVADRVAEVDKVFGAQLRALVYHSTNRTAEAISELRTALATYETSELAQQAFRLMVESNRSDEAREMMTAWLVDRPDDVESLQMMSALLIREGDYEASSIHLERAYSLLPNNPVVLNNLAWVRYELGRPGALAMARRAYRLASNAPAVTDTLGWILVREGEVEEGLKLLYTASEAAPEVGDIAYHLAYALAESGKSDEAKAVLDRALKSGSEVKFDQERSQATALLAKLKGG